MLVSKGDEGGWLDPSLPPYVKLDLLGNYLCDRKMLGIIQKRAIFGGSIHVYSILEFKKGYESVFENFEF